MKRILSRGFLGIDESNHGKTPEVFVAVYSDDERHIRLQEHLLEKNREKGNLGEELKHFDYRFVLFNHRFKQYFNEYQIKAIAISEFISFFQNHEHFGALEKVIFDGELRRQDINLVRMILSPMPSPAITSVVQGDELIPLVNKADRAASLLFKYYTKNPGRRSGRYERYLLTPNLSLYAKLINQ